MGNYIIRRLLLVIPNVFLVTILVFFLVRFIPGDVVDMMMAEQEVYAGQKLAREALIHKLGMDVPIHIQYVRWVGAIISQGNLGESLWSNEPILKSLVERLPVSLELGIIALIIGQLLAIPVGVFAAVRQDTLGDYTARSMAIIFLAVPNFFMATLIIIYPALWWDWMPSLQYIPITENLLGNLGMIIVPGLIMGLHSAGSSMRLMRTTMLDVLRQDYIRTAWSKGIKEKDVIIRHTLKNALIPVVTNIGLHIPAIVAGTVIMESIFNLPGMGRLLVEALNQRDYPLVSGINLFFAMFVVVTNICVDLSYAYLDPRIHYQ